MKDLTRAVWLLVALHGLGGCEQKMDFGFTATARFTMPEVTAGTPAAACLDDLASADSLVVTEPVNARISELGSMSEYAFRKQERRRQRDWDQRYCRRQAECRALVADPRASAADIDDSVELCLTDRTQRRVAMGL